MRLSSHAKARLTERLPTVSISEVLADLARVKKYAVGWKGGKKVKKVEGMYGAYIFTNSKIITIIVS